MSRTDSAIWGGWLFRWPFWLTSVIRKLFNSAILLCKKFKRFQAFILRTSPWNRGGVGLNTIKYLRCTWRWFWSKVEFRRLTLIWWRTYSARHVLSYICLSGKTIPTYFQHFFVNEITKFSLSPCPIGRFKRHVQPVIGKIYPLKCYTFL